MAVFGEGGRRSWSEAGIVRWTSPFSSLGLYVAFMAWNCASVCAEREFGAEVVGSAADAGAGAEVASMSSSVSERAMERKPFKGSGSASEPPAEPMADMRPAG